MKCLTCKSETSNPKFCSHSCAAKFNNASKSVNRRKPEGACRICATPISTRKTWCNDCLNLYSGSPPRKSRTFTPNLEDSGQDSASRGVVNNCSCGSIIAHSSQSCYSCFAKRSAEERRVVKINEWLDGTWRGGTDIRLSTIVKRFLLEESNYSCSKCGFNTPHPDDNKTILEINHIDGNGINHIRSNLEVICPNCHALTSTYRGRNLGHGRPVSYIRKSKT